MPLEVELQGMDEGRRLKNRGGEVRDEEVRVIGRVGNIYVSGCVGDAELPPSHVGRSVGASVD